jgi:hypothetical protein
MTELRAAHELMNETDAPIYWVAHGPDLAFGTLQPGGHLATGQETFEQFTSLRLWRGRVTELGSSFK